MIPCGVSFLGTKIRITQWKLNQNRKNFNPLVSGPSWFELGKKTGGRKSRWTVPIRLENYLWQLAVYAIEWKLWGGTKCNFKKTLSTISADYGAHEKILRRTTKCCLSLCDTAVHRRRIKTEEKAKVITAVWGTELIKFLAMLAVFHQDDLKKGWIEKRLLGGMDDLKNGWSSGSHHTKSAPYQNTVDVFPKAFVKIILAAG